MRTVSVLKPLVFVLGLAPAAWLGFRVYTGRLTANPVEDITLATGIWTLRFLMIALAITPVRRLTGWNQVVQYRRMLGLFAFFYGTLHLLTYIVLDQALAFGFIFADIAKRPYITAGMVAFALMVPLAVTSTKGWIRRLGRRWQLLHRLVYVSGIAAVLHYYWKVKADTTYPLRYALLLAILFAVRFWWMQRSAARQSARATPA